MALAPVAPVGALALLTGKVVPLAAPVAAPPPDASFRVPVLGGPVFLGERLDSPDAPPAAAVAAKASSESRSHAHVAALLAGLAPKSPPAPASPTGTAGGSATDAFGPEVAGLAASASRRRRHLFVSSPPGIGKTTMVQRLLQKLKQDERPSTLDITGFYTEEVRDSAGQRSGFDVVRVGEVKPGAAHRAPLARHGNDPPKVGKYSINLDTLEGFAIPTIEPPKRDLPPPPPLPENPRLYTFPDGRVEAVSFLYDEQPAAGPSPLVGPLPGGSPEADASEAAAGSPSASPAQDAEQSSAPAAPVAVIHIPSTGQEERVDPERLKPVPSGWRPPDDPALDEESDDGGPVRLVVCDEVGKMELLSLKFPAALLAALDSRGTVLGTLPQPARGQREHELVENVRRRPDVKLVRLTRNNREGMLEQAYTELRDCLGLGEPGAERPPKAPKKKKKTAAASAAGKPAKSETGADGDAKKAERAAKRKEREAKERELAKQRGELAKKAREERKRRAEARKSLQKTGSMELGSDSSDVEGLQATPLVDDLIDDDDDVEAQPSKPIDVDTAAAAAAAALAGGRASARKARRVSGAPALLPATAARAAASPAAGSPASPSPAAGASAPALVSLD